MASARQTPSRRQPSRQTTPPSPRRSQAYHRHEEEQRAARTQRRVTIGAIAVLVVVGIMVVAGYLYFAYLPANTRILTVGSARYDAEAVAQRAAFLATRGDQLTAQAIQRDPVSGTLDALTKQETLLQAGASEVEAVTDAEIQTALRERLGVTDAGATAQRDERYTLFMEGAPVSKETFEQHDLRALLIERKLSAKFRAALPNEGPQVHLEQVESIDRAQIERIASAVAGGMDFMAASAQAGLPRTKEQLDIGWVPVEVVARGADTSTVQPGKTSDIVDVPQGWAIYRVIEREEARAYTDAQKDEIAPAQVRRWVESQAGPLKVERNLSPSSETWILREMQKIVQRMQAAIARAAEAKR